MSLEQNIRKWAAASPTVVKDWIAQSDSINKDLKEQSKALRARARDLEQNNDYAYKFLGLSELNTIGEHGIRLQVKARTNRGKLDTRINRLVEKAFTKWQRAETCSIDGRLNWIEIQRLIIRSCARDGEVLIRFVRTNDSIQLAIYDADFLDNDLNRPPGQNQNQIIQGIEVNAQGRPVAYYLLKSNPNDMPTLFGKPSTREYEVVSANDVIHIYKTDRPNQVRGASWMASVMIHMLMLNRYERAEMAAAEMSAKKIGFYTTPTGDYLDGEKAQEYGLPTDVNGLGMMELPTGVDVNLLDPNHPVSAYADYVSGVLKGIAAGLGVTYHALSGDLTQVNFSSIRAGTIEERDRWKAVQQWLISKLHTPVFERWLQQNAPSLGLSQADVDRIEITWQPRGWTWVDPLKDLQSHQLAYQLGVTSLSEIAGASGRDLEEVFDQRAKEKALAQEYGLEINSINTEVIPDEEN